MKKETVIAGVVVTVMLAVMAGVGFVIWHTLQNNKPVKQSRKPTTIADSSSEGSLLGVGDGSGLGGSGIDLGQGQAQNLGTSGGNGGSGGNTSSSTQKQNFTEYEKYKKEKGALFGEIEQGTGPDVKANSKVSIYYKGYLLNGEVFDNQWPGSPNDKPKPFEFQIGTDQIIAGLQQGIFGMKMGGKRRVIVPPAVGYGEKGFKSIPPDSVLIFDVELLKVE